MSCLSIIVNLKRLSTSDSHKKQTTGDCRSHSTAYDKGSCFAMACVEKQSDHLPWAGVHEVWLSLLALSDSCRGVE